MPQPASSAVDDLVHAEREDHDLPRRAAQHLAGLDHVAPPRDHQQEDCTGSGDGADRHAKGFEQEEAGQQQREDDPPGAEGRNVADRFSGRAQRPHVIVFWEVAPEEQQQHAQRGGDRYQVDRHHHGRVCAEPDLEEVG